MTTMAPARKKRAQTKPQESQGPKRTIASFKGSEEFAEWLTSLLKHERIPISSLIEKSLILYAKHVGFEEPPPER